MIDVKELRIGNLLDAEGDIVKISGFMPDGVKEIEDDKITIWVLNEDDPYYEACYPEHLKPIPLTEKWLLRFGFEKKTGKYGSHFQDKNCWIYLIKSGFEFELITKYDRFNLFRVYKYVHQLQNLYFALTGEELTIE